MLSPLFREHPSLSRSLSTWGSLYIKMFICLHINMKPLSIHAVGGQYSFPKETHEVSFSNFRSEYFL